MLSTLNLYMMSVNCISIRLEKMDSLRKSYGRVYARNKDCEDGFETNIWPLAACPCLRMSSAKLLCPWQDVLRQLVVSRPGSDCDLFLGDPPRLGIFRPFLSGHTGASGEAASARPLTSGLGAQWEMQTGRFSFSRWTSLGPRLFLHLASSCSRTSCSPSSVSHLLVCTCVSLSLFPIFPVMALLWPVKQLLAFKMQAD